MIYVVDVSGSTADITGLDCDGSGVSDDVDDLNDDGTAGDIVDCEIAAVLALNASVRQRDVAVGLIAFGSSAAAADLQPGPADEALVSPPDRDTNNDDGKRIADLTEVGLSLDQGSIASFSRRTVGTGTDFNEALRATG